MTRRDKCHLIARRAAKLSSPQAVIAWMSLAQSLDEFGEMDMPKFKHLLRAIRVATINASRK